jgi:beta-glucanase (GH16 family)
MKKIKLFVLAMVLGLVVFSCPQQSSDSQGTAQPTVLGITLLDGNGAAVTASQINANTGSTVQFGVNVQVQNGASKIVSWSIAGNGSPNTGIQYGLLTIAASETPGTILTVTVTSTADTSKTAAVQVKLQAPTTPPLYTINSSGPFTGGSVTSNKSTAGQGDDITLTAAPEPGYGLASITVTKETGGTVGTNGSGNTRTFPMPDANVIVTAVFNSLSFAYTQAFYASKDFNVSDCSFYDKFEGTSVDMSKWGYQNGNGDKYIENGWGNQERQSYKTQNAVIENGILKLIAKAETFNGKNYTSGRLVSANSKGLPAVGEPEEGTGVKFAQTYGRMEAKIRMSGAFQGAWPAFWMMPVADTYGGWPRSGEIDIMEMVGAKPNHASSTLHMKPNWGTWQSQYQHVDATFQNNSDFTDWHVYGVYWTPTEITFLLDGYETRTFTPSWWNSPWYAANGHTSTSAPFDKDFHLILNLALDSGQFSTQNGLGNTPPAGWTGGAMEVEWVRCYTRENDPWPKSFGTHPASLKQNGGN